MTAHSCRDLCEPTPNAALAIQFRFKFQVPAADSASRTQQKPSAEHFGEAQPGTTQNGTLDVAGSPHRRVGIGIGRHPESGPQAKIGLGLGSQAEILAGHAGPLLLCAR